jgi:hypothetical protein
MTVGEVAAEYCFFFLTKQQSIVIEGVLHSAYTQQPEHNVRT